MLKINKLIVLGVFAFAANLFGAEFTVASYNCGGLSEHYDYLRAGVMQKVMEERHIAEPEIMALNEKIQQLALKKLFSSESDRQTVQMEWELKGYDADCRRLFFHPTDSSSPHAKWYKISSEAISSYKTRPVTIYDDEVADRFHEYLDECLDLPGARLNERLDEARSLIAKRIFARHMKFDVICLQEADYLDDTLFPSHYQLLLTEGKHSKNGLAWNTERFELVESLCDLFGTGAAAKLRDKQTNQNVLVVSGHLTGCDPFTPIYQKTSSLQSCDAAVAQPMEKSDCEKGNRELVEILKKLDETPADLRVVGMDFNVTATHPRLEILKEAGYELDCENFLEPTCTNPYYLLNTRIDWIAIKPNLNEKVGIANIPVQSVSLNCLRTNHSDHKPVAAKIRY